ncbi:MAG: hypothetical protein QM651_06695 [Rhodoblastus sp.]
MNAILGLLFVLWCAAGLIVAGGFAARGADVALGEPASLTRGARLLLLPGAFLLWPVVLWRWLRAERAA